MGKIICILVLYNPDITLLTKVVSAIVNQVDCLWISDNSFHFSSKLSSIVNQSKVIYRKMPDNIGIAAAQNVGIKYAINEKFDYLYFLDQDSISPANIIEGLYSQYKSLEEDEVMVGAIGPRPFNRWLGKDYKGAIKKGKYYNPNLTEVGELISSASFISVGNFVKSGLMDESLFIDGVDHEWCWRSKQLWGARFFVFEDLKLSHALGEGDRRLLFWFVSIPTPFRTYYQFRNYFILLKRNYVPIYWKCSNGVKYFIKLFYFPLCVSPRVKYFNNIVRGVLNGIVTKRTNFVAIKNLYHYE